MVSNIITGDNIKVDLTQIWCECLYWFSGLGIGPVVVPCEHGNEPFGSINGGECSSPVERPSAFQKKKLTTWQLAAELRDSIWK
jgi:hypothetical protein